MAGGLARCEDLGGRRHLVVDVARRQLRLAGDRLNYVGLVVVLGIVQGNGPLTARRIFETVDGSTTTIRSPFPC